MQSALRRRSSSRRLVGLAVACALAMVAFGGCALSIGQSPATPSGNGITVPIRVLQQGGATRIEADLTIDKRGPFIFVIDTGAETSAIDTALTRELGLKRDGPPHQVGGVGGSINAFPVKIDSWSLQTLKLPATDIDSASIGGSLGGNEDGLLGSDILSQFGTITINFSASQLTVYKQIA